MRFWAVRCDGDIVKFKDKKRLIDFILSNRFRLPALVKAIIISNGREFFAAEFDPENRYGCWHVYKSTKNPLIRSCGISYSIHPMAVVDDPKKICKIFAKL